MPCVLCSFTDRLNIIRNLLLNSQVEFSFNLTPSTHIKGHTLDLVLTSGFDVTNLEVLESGISDHSFVLFQSLQLHTTLSAPVCRHLTRAFHSSTVMQFDEIYASTYQSQITEVITSTADTAQLIEIFNTTCTDILDQVAPLKSLRYKNKSNTQPWINDHTRSIRQKCRKAECKCKKDKLKTISSHCQDCKI